MRRRFCDTKKCQKEAPQIKILALDQARRGGWSIFDAQSKALLSHGTFSFPAKFEFSKAVYEITRIAAELIENNGIGMVFIEDTQFQKNANSFKKLAQLQGALINLCEGLGVPCACVPPVRWQAFCGARGRSAREVKSGEAAQVRKATKLLSVQFVKQRFCIDTDNDNLADAVCIGWYAVNHLAGGSENA